MNIISFGEDMNEVSGLGGFYERCCRAAIIAGAQWLARHRTFNAPEIEHAIRTALVARDDGTKVSLGYELTPEQLGLAMYHVRFIAEHGWKKYTEKMSVPPRIYGEEDVA